MKPITIESPMGLDRLATWDEVFRAMSSSSQCTIELARRRDDSSEMDSAFSGRTANLSEDDMWLVFASEMPDSKSN
jgi:hypothetical protein